MAPLSACDEMLHGILYLRVWVVVVTVVSLVPFLVTVVVVVLKEEKNVKQSS